MALDVGGAGCDDPPVTTPDDIGRVHAPVGLNLGAVTPQEIAVSILAELIGVKYGKIGADATDTDSASAASLRWIPRSAAETTSV